MDNDHDGHVNNVAYYAFFYTAVNGFLIEATGTDIRDLPAIGIVAESSCKFLSAVSFPDTIHAGLGDRAARREERHLTASGCFVETNTRAMRDRAVRPRLRRLPHASAG